MKGKCLSPVNIQGTDFPWGRQWGARQTQALEEGWAAPRQGQQRQSTPEHCTPDATETNRRAATAKREALERRMKTPRAPFANIYFSRVSLRKWRATKAQVPDQSRTLPNLLKNAHVALWEGFESSRDGNHMLAYPPGKSPMCKPAGRPPTNYMCTSARWVSLTFLRTKTEGGRKVPTLWKSLTHDMCRFAVEKESHPSKRVEEAAWQDKVAHSLLSLPGFISPDNQETCYRLMWAGKSLVSHTTYCLA